MILYKVLGVPSASRSSTAASVAPLPPGKPLALLAYLACAPNSSATRPRLVDLLWSDVDLDAGKHALRQTLWYTKRRLGEGIIVAENDHLVLAPGYHCDRTDFLAAIDRGDLEAAVNLYTGPFFPDFAAPGGAEFERWADVERRHLCGKFVRAAEDVCRRWLHQGNTRPAIALARRARDADPENESLWRLVLESLLAASDRIGAASEADALIRRLADDEREPEVATNAVLRAVRNIDQSRTGAADTRATLIAELVGREHEFSLVISAWERTRGGTAAHLHLTAPAGLGKTRLIADIEARLRASRARVVRLRAAPGERQMPFALAAELAASLAKLRGAAGVSPGAASSLVALNPVVSTWLSASPDIATGDDILRRRSLAIHELLVAVSAETPVALLIDDLHWVDAESLQLLNSLASHLQNVSALLVTASRPPSPFPTDGAAQQMVPLEPLDASQVGAMVASIARLPDEAWADGLPGELHSATGGSPLFVLELLQFALDRQRLSIEGGSWRCPNNEALLVDMRPGRAVERRVAELDSAARTLLLALALSGVATPSITLAHAVERSEHDVEATLARLEQAGLIVRDGANWLPQHDEIASAATTAADESSRRKTQRGLAAAYAVTAHGDTVVTHRALSHALLSGDDALLSRVSGEFLRVARAQGDTRTPRAILSSTLGSSAPPAIIRGIVATLPMRERVSWVIVRRYAAVIMTIAVVAAGSARGLLQLQQKPANELIVEVVDGDDTALYQIGRIYSPNEPDVPLTVEDGRGLSGQYIHALELVHATESPDRKIWVGWRNVGEQPNPELFTWRGGDSEQMVAYSKEDDVAPSWSPDGKWILFLSRRWSDRSSVDKNFNTDIALENVSSGDVRRVVATADNENSPAFSPDGSRIAYTVVRSDTSRREVCWISFDGLTQHCRKLPNVTPTGGARWMGTNAVIFVGDLRANEKPGLFKWLIDLDSIVVLDSTANSYAMSPDGREVFFQQTDTLTATVRSYVAPTSDFTRRRLLQATGTIRRVVWRAPRNPLPHLASIRLENADTAVPANTKIAMTARTFDRLGNELVGIPLRYDVLDSAGVSITEQGQLFAQQPGTVRVRVSAGGYVTDTLPI